MADVSRRLLHRFDDMAGCWNILRSLAHGRLTICFVRSGEAGTGDIASGHARSGRQRTGTRLANVRGFFLWETVLPNSNGLEKPGPIRSAGMTESSLPWERGTPRERPQRLLPSSYDWHGGVGEKTFRLPPPPPHLSRVLRMARSEADARTTDRGDGGLRRRSADRHER